MRYEHTQSSLIAPLIVDTLVVLVVVVMFVAGSPLLPIVVTVAAGAVVVLVAVAFSRLTVRVDDDAVEAVFTFGWPRHRIALSDIAVARPVRNRWYHGWGLRKISGGWMYNVAGFDAVEVERRTGPKFRIGTDQPTELAAAIAAAR